MNILKFFSAKSAAVKRMEAVFPHILSGNCTGDQGLWKAESRDMVDVGDNVVLFSSTEVFEKIAYATANHFFGKDWLNKNPKWGKGTLTIGNKQMEFGRKADGTELAIKLFGSVGVK